MTFNEYKEEIQNVFVKVWKDAGSEVKDPSDIFAYVTEDTVLELYNKGVSAQEAYFVCAMASMKFKKGGR